MTVLPVKTEIWQLLLFVALIVASVPGWGDDLDGKPSGFSTDERVGSVSDYPIAVHFNLKEPAFVTLVVEDAEGKRVRNLISEVEFPAGDNTVSWDGMDDTTPDIDAAEHATYHISGRLVPPGDYRVYGLVHPRVNAVYELTTYTNGSPPWRTKDSSSEWLANHTPPSAVLFVPEKRAPQRAGKLASGGQIMVGSK